MVASEQISARVGVEFKRALRDGVRATGKTQRQALEMAILCWRHQGYPELLDLLAAQNGHSPMRKRRVRTPT